MRKEKSMKKMGGVDFAKHLEASNQLGARPLAATNFGSSETFGGVAGSFETSSRAPMKKSRSTLPESDIDFSPAQQAQ